MQGSNWLKIDTKMYIPSKYKFASHAHGALKGSLASQCVNFQEGTEVKLMNLDTGFAFFLCCKNPAW